MYMYVYIYTGAVFGVLAHTLPKRSDPIPMRQFHNLLFIRTVYGTTLEATQGKIFKKSPTDATSGR